MKTTVNPDGSITSKGSGKLIGGELFTPGQPLSERQYQAVKFGKMMNPNKKYDNNVLRSYAMYEDNNVEKTIIIPSSSQQEILNDGESKEKIIPLVMGSNGGGSSEMAEALYMGG